MPEEVKEMERTESGTADEPRQRGGAAKGNKDAQAGEASALDLVEEGSIESFPASDPPSWMPPITSLGPPRG